MKWYPDKPSIGIVRIGTACRANQEGPGPRPLTSGGWLRLEQAIRCRTKSEVPPPIVATEVWTSGWRRKFVQTLGALPVSCSGTEPKTVGRRDEGQKRGPGTHVPGSSLHPYPTQAPADTGHGWRMVSLTTTARIKTEKVCGT